MIPKSLQISGFLSYRQPVHLDFASFSLACISGSNGAGKSSLLDAMTWALFGQARKRDDSLINIHPEVESAEVIFVFEYEGNVYRIQRSAPRGKTNLLEFHISQDPVTSETPSDWRALTERTMRETQNRIQQILRMDYDTFINASFFLQGKADQFTQQRPGDRKRILGSILGLEVWEEYRQRTAGLRKDVEGKVKTLQGALVEITAELNEESDRKERLERLESELSGLVEARKLQVSALESHRRTAAALAEQRKLVETLSRQAEAAVRRQQGLLDRLADRQDEQEKYSGLLARADEIRIAYKAWQATREALQHWDKIADSYRQQERLRQEPETEIIAEKSRLEQELANLKAQQQEVETARAGLSVLEAKLAEAQKSLAEAESQMLRREGFEADLSRARKEHPLLLAESQRLKVEMKELKEYIDLLNQPDQAVCPFCGQPLEAGERDRLIESLKVQGQEKGDRFRKNSAQLESANEIERGLEEEINRLKNAQPSYLANARVVEQVTVQKEQVAVLLETWESESEPRMAVIAQQLAQDDFCPQARQRLAEIETKMRATGYDPDRHDADRKAEVGGRQSEEDLREMEKAQASLTSLDREIDDLLAQAAQAADEVETLQAEYRAGLESLQQAEAQVPDINTLEVQLFNLQERENQLRIEVGAARQKVEVLDDLRVRQAALEVEQEGLNLVIGRYRQLERAFSRDGVPALLIEQALPQIEERANYLLDRLSGGGMNVRFITQAAYKDKSREDMRETLEIQISDSSGSRDYELYSGGEAFRVNFAIRLALSEVLAQRAGARLQMLVIDEGFGSQDAQGRQRLVEAINLVKDDFAKVLVITHIDELKDSFQNQIEVIKTPTGSQVRMV